MSREFSCKYQCGVKLHYDNGQVLDGSNAKHYCPNFPKSQRPRALLSYDAPEHELELALEHLINALNAISKTTAYDLTARPRGGQKN